jgi:hypothetical protein
MEFKDKFGTRRVEHKVGAAIVPAREIRIVFI